MRTAAVWVPEFPAQALRRCCPDLIEAPLAVVAGPSPRDRVVAVTAEVAALGVRGGMTATQARQAATGAVLRTVPSEMAAAAEAALADVGRSFSPRVKRHAADEVLFDASGLEPRWGGDGNLGHELLRAARRVGFEAQVGIAAGVAVARLAARVGACTVVPAGGERAFVAPLPVEMLEPPAAVAATLGRWGIFLAGELARLARNEVRLRLGEAGVAMHRLACGEEDAPLIPDPWPEELREGVALDEAIGGLEAFLFVLRGVLSRLATRLELRGQGFAAVRLDLALEGGERREVVVPLIAPTADVATVLAFVRLRLEASPPGAPVEGIAAVATPGKVRLAQGGLFAPPLPAPGRLATGLVRIAALVGAERVGAPELADTHRPGVFAVAPFHPPSVDPAGHEAGDPRQARLPAALRPVLRAFRPPRPVDVTVVGGRPVAARGDGFGGQVVALAGPYRMSGEWWTDAPFAREEFDVATADGAVWRLACDGAAGRWTAEGVYD